MEPIAKVVGSIEPAASEEERAHARYEDVWHELTAVKARLADALNAIAAQARAFEDLEVYCRRHVKRFDAIASRIEKRANAQPPRR